MKIFLDTVGCRLNQSELETFASQFRSAGHQVVDSPAGADLVVVNTCTVTVEATSDSRQKIRQAHRAGAPAIIAAGCWATLEPGAAGLLPGVSQVITNPHKDQLVQQVLGIAPEAFDLEPLARQPIPGAHLRTRAFIKVQDGCDNACTYCITTLARGRAASRPVKDILADIHAAGCGGVKEIVLTGVHLGSWGCDWRSGANLECLLGTILRECDLPRIRLSSLEPWDLDDEFFSLWQDSRLCRHLHLPLQSGSADTLRRMARQTTPEKFTRLVETARRAIPGLAITTDLIAGFPGETDAAFEESLEFVRQMEFAGGHVFPYSERPGTAAAHFPNPVPDKVRRQRAARLRSALEESGRRYRQGFVGQVQSVLWETASGLGPDGWNLSGLTDNYIRVSATSPMRAWNEIAQIRITKVTKVGVEGEVIPAVNQLPSLASSTDNK